MTSEKGSRKDNKNQNNQNIQVFVRLRPLNQRERDIKSLGVVEVINNREVTVRSNQPIHSKKFTFDQAFGPHAKQVEVYQHVVSPLIEEVLCGYNCTVFAYGQTGTGKTHTMVGESAGDESNWQSDPLAGIIPRALSQLFDELRISNTEYTVRVSYLELYNEELFDLLSSSEDNSKLRIYEDVTRKGANIVNGLEEITVYNKNEVYKIMAQGQERKKVASTLMNAQSSRSHTVFTIVVHMKENSPEGEELVKIGKLNLVDLAGSENISKAGSDNPAKRERARECVNINQSLLTLGRVITALVERHPHVPYRASKLTRILQESLGGRTKTSIIATISPGHKDIEETLSTLEYANRAKNIQNKPEVNQKMTKKAILKEFAEEIDKLKRDLQAARDKNGVYLANETFAEMTLKDEEQRKEISELLLRKRAMEEEKEKLESVFTELNQTLQERATELDNTRRAMETTREQLVNTKNILQTTRLHCEEQKHLVSKHQATEVELSAQARDIITVADTAANHVQCLHESVDKRRTVESSNLEVTQAYRQQSATFRNNMAAGVRHFVDTLSAALLDAHEQTDNYTKSTTNTLEENKQTLDHLTQKIIEAINEAKSTCSTAHSTLTSSTEEHRNSLRHCVHTHGDAMRATLHTCIKLASAGKRHAAGWKAPETIRSLLKGWLSDALSRVSALQRSHGAFNARCRAVEARRGAAARAQRDARRDRVASASSRIDAALALLETEKTLLEQRLAKQQADIEQERLDSESRLSRWMEEERRLLEERLARHAAAEREATGRRLAQRMAEVQAERDAVEQRVKCIEAWRQEQMAAMEEENKMADDDLSQLEGGRDECLECMDKFGKELVEGATAMSADLEAFSGNVIQVTDHLIAELLRLITQEADQIEREASSAIAASEQASAALLENSDRMLANMLAGTKTAVDSVVDSVESTSTSAISTLATLASSQSSLVSLSRAYLAAQSAATQRTQQQIEKLTTDVSAVLTQQEQLENSALGERFRVYSPTGKTPVRQEYRLPRSLAATSPHERILARFRAMRESDDEECVIVEPAPASDCESSVSEDSVLAGSTPPAPVAIAKCTSETDIYYRQTTGKENPFARPVSHKKASRLPAPTSVKKPLVERNDQH